MTPARILVAPLALAAFTVSCSPAPHAQLETADVTLGLTPSASVATHPSAAPSVVRPAAVKGEFPKAHDNPPLCACFRWFNQMPPNKENPCGGLSDDVDEFSVPECLRAHDLEKDCQGYRECFTMEPSGVAKCLDDEIFTGPSPSTRCAKKCTLKQGGCPADEECTLENTHVEGQAYCVPK